LKQNVKHPTIMGRSKPAPKRRRIEEEEAEKAAIQTLLNAPPDQVEAAAAEATRSDCETWPQLSLEDNAKVPNWLTGLGTSRTIVDPHFQALKDLHEEIKNQATTWVSWSGSLQDPRKRAFGFLPNTLGYEEKIREFLDISTPWKTDEDGNEERIRNHRAMVVLKELPLGVSEAIEHICQVFSAGLDEYSPLKAYLKYSNLIAAQPNLHCGRNLLSTHVDHPLKDGFGVVIITVGVVGSGKILLQDSTATHRMTMEVSQGQAYMLADKARDACAHGVLASESHRESLNFRFGLHDFPAPTSNLQLIPAQQVLKYWETDMKGAGENIISSRR
jgi:hypothetical protein